MFAVATRIASRARLIAGCVGPAETVIAEIRRIVTLVRPIAVNARPVMMATAIPLQRPVTVVPKTAVNVRGALMVAARALKLARHARRIAGYVQSAQTRVAKVLMKPVPIVLRTAGNVRLATV